MILCCGEALIDMIPTATSDGGEGFVPHPGGSVFNTAISLGRLGVQAGMLTGLSTDMFGQKLLTALHASHVDTSLIITSERPSTLAFVQLTNGQAEYAFFDENTAGRMLMMADVPTIPNEVEALYFGGISLACEPCADTYAELLRDQSEGRAVMVDPNIRPAFIKDIDRYRARLDLVMSYADVVKVSDEDLNWLFPSPLSLREKVECLLERGVKLVILTRGENGATGITADGLDVSVPVRKVDVVDTVGAGDTFNAGILAKLSDLGQLSKQGLCGLSAETVEAALLYGTRVAAITVSRVGANPPWLDEVA